MKKKMCEAIKDVLNVCCSKKPEVIFSDGKYQVKCKCCDKHISSFSPTEILMKRNNYFK